MRKIEVAIQMYFQKQLFLLYLVNQEKLLVVSGKCFSHPFMVAGLGTTQ